MRRYLYTAVGVVVAALVAVVAILGARVHRLTAERDRYRTNTHTLLTEVRTYQTRDSLHAASVSALELRLSEYRRYRAADAETIKALRVRLRDLEAVGSAQSATIIDLRAQLRDSIVYVDRYIVDTLQCLDIGDEWFTLAGCINRAGEFRGRFECHDSLLITETVKYHRFLGFLWRTKRVKNRQFDIVSRNPHTKIDDFEVVIVKK